MSPGLRLPFLRRGAMALSAGAFIWLLILAARRRAGQGGRSPMSAETLWKKRLARLPVPRRPVGRDHRDHLRSQGGQGRPTSGWSRRAAASPRTTRETAIPSGAPTAAGSPSSRSARGTTRPRSGSSPWGRRGPADHEVPTGAASARWFPDSSRIAFISWVWKDLSSWEDQAKRLKERKESKVSAKVWDKPIIRYWDHWVEDRDPHLYSIGLDGGDPVAITLPARRCLPRDEPDATSYDISPDGAEVAFVSDIDRTGVDGNEDIFTVPVAGGEARNVTTDNLAERHRPLYSPDGHWLAFGRQTIKGFYADRVRLCCATGAPARTASPPTRGTAP